MATIREMLFNHAYLCCSSARLGENKKHEIVIEFILLNYFSIDFLHPALQLRFSFAGPIKGWHCTNFYDITGSWQDNYLCSNRDIGLVYFYRHDRNLDNLNLKCVHLAEPGDGVWNDNRFCLPVNSKIELVWSFYGRVHGMQCISVAEPGHPVSHDNYLCWKEHI